MFVMGVNINLILHVWLMPLARKHLGINVHDKTDKLYFSKKCGSGDRNGINVCEPSAIPSFQWGRRDVSGGGML